jgi:hypothetical protein
LGYLNTGFPNTRFFGDPGSRDQKGDRMKSSEVRKIANELVRQYMDADVREDQDMHTRDDVIQDFIHWLEVELKGGN